jgi:hypothetical protein
MQPESRALLLLVSSLNYYSVLKMKVICFTETSVDFHWTARGYILEDKTLNSLIFDMIGDFMVPKY